MLALIVLMPFVFMIIGSLVEDYKDKKATERSGYGKDWGGQA